MVFKKGHKTWNYGLSADPNNPNYDERVAKYVKAHTGKRGALRKTWKWTDEARARHSKRMIEVHKDINNYKEKVRWSDEARLKLSNKIRGDPYLLAIRSEAGKLNKGRIPWNKNLKKETDPRVAKYANTMKGMPKSEEHRNSLREAKLAQSPEERSRIARIAGTVSMAKLTPEERSKKALKGFLSIPKFNTTIELMLQESLNTHGIEYTTQVSILDITAVDIFINPNICLFADGNYWHSLPGKQEKDETLNKILIENGYKVFRFWGSEIRKNADQCIEKVIKEIKSS